MIEKIISYSILLNVGFVSDIEYRTQLDKLYTKMPDNELLFNLEWHASDIQKSLSLTQEYCTNNKIDYDVLGRCLFDKIQEVYISRTLNIQIFAGKVYSAWKLLPPGIQEMEPFWTMSYADNPLSWGDEQKTRDLYEKMFGFYR